MSVLALSPSDKIPGSIKRFPPIPSFFLGSLGLVSIFGATFCLYKAYIQGLPYVYLPLDTEWQKAWQAETSPDQDTQKPVTIEVVGAVEKPGVFTLTPGSRVQDAVLQAGGFLNQANQSYIHQELRLAATLKDQDKIYIPFQTENVSKASIPAVSTGTNTTASSLNSVTKAQLEAIAGIGAVRSATVLEGIPYQNVADFMERSGLPDSIAEDVLKEYHL